MLHQDTSGIDKLDVYAWMAEQKLKNKDFYLILDLLNNIISLTLNIYTNLF